MYSVVHFPKERSVEAVPSSWLKVQSGATYCRWPSKLSSDKISRKIKKKADPSSDWVLVECQEKYNCICYEEARNKCKELSYLTATETSSEDDVAETQSESTDSEPLPKPPTEKKRKFISKPSTSKSSTIAQPLTVSTGEIEVGSQQPAKRTKLISHSSTDVQYSEVENTNLQAVNDKLSEISEKLDSNRTLYITSIANLQKTLVDCVEEVKQMKKKENRKTVLNSTSFPSLPLASLQNLEEFEKDLEDKAGDLVLYLSSFGTPQISTSVHSLMKLVLKNEIAVLYSMHGKGGKRKFIDLKLCSCVRG